MGLRRLVWGRSASPDGRLRYGLAVVASTAALALALSLTSCGGGSHASSLGEVTSPPSAAPRPGGTYNHPLQYDVSSLLPFRAWELDSSAVVAHQIFEGLVGYETQADGGVATVPCLAESWSADDEATVWTFRLRRGVRFQAPVGREMTAADVVADYRYAADPRTKAIAAYMYAIIEGTDDDGLIAAEHADELGVEALDRYTVRFTLKHPFAAFPDTLGNPAAWVWPVDYLERVGRADFEERPVGTGPFVLSRRVRGDHIDLRRNPSWWNASSGQPYLESVHFQVIGSVSAELLAFQKGTIDYAWVPQGQVAASRSLPQVTSGAWSASSVPLLGMRYVGFNMRDPVVGGEGGLPIRQAIAGAIDREALVSSVYDGVPIPQTGPVPPILAGWADGEPVPPYDPAEAARLYAAAGSPPLELVYLRDNREAVDTARWLRSACAAAGIDLEIRPVSWEDAMAVWGTKRMPAIFLSGWIADYPAAENFLYDQFHSSMSGGGGTLYSDADVDRLLSLARSTSDVGRRYDLNRRAAAEIMADLPIIPLIEFAEYGLLSTRIDGFSVDPLCGVDAWKLWVR